MTAQSRPTREVIDIQPSASDASSKTQVLVKTDQLHVVRLAVPAGKEIPTHSAPGEMTIQCLVGRVDFIVGDETHHLQTGQLLSLKAHDPHSIRGVEDGALLLTIFEADCRTTEAVQEASEESFPASDAPAWTGVTGP